MQAKQHIVFQTKNNERILEFIKQRNKNFKDFPTKMIDFCLERNRKAIILDKVMVNADTLLQYLTVVSDDIKAHTAMHFQIITDIRLDCSLDPT
ncbi:15144_t:CDS:2 [Funneliformis geosporum]|uniref:15144_t:CDS:1 n=1 Tax=Funneliformis geosporum TaxID=1117311 RepID=A0A9W4SS99_9GLOM|nr:15144_t:CDS:2 [Funneliformis geosporum]